MNRLSIMLLFLLGSKAQGQMVQEGNAFAESDVVSATAVQNDAAEGPGTGSDQPGGIFEGEDPIAAPVDNFIPLLFSFALGLIFYKRKKILKFGL